MTSKTPQKKKEKRHTYTDAQILKACLSHLAISLSSSSPGVSFLALPLAFLTKPYRTRSSSPATPHALHPLHAERLRGPLRRHLAADAVVTPAALFPPCSPHPWFLISPGPIRLLALPDSSGPRVRVRHGAASRGQAPQEGGRGEEGRNGGSGGGAGCAWRRLVGWLLHADGRCVPLRCSRPYVSTRFVCADSVPREHLFSFFLSCHLDLIMTRA